MISGAEVNRVDPLVLYVDDERANRVVFELALRAQFRILSVGSGEEALELLPRTDVAVVVSDMRMQGMNGEQLLRAIKERSPQTIRMVLTAYSDIDPILRAINEGLVARYIVKPWTLTEIIQVLRWATEAWRFSRDSGELNRRLLETERLATLGTITAAIAHDLNQPLSALRLDAKQLEVVPTLVPLIDRVLDGIALSDDERGEVRESLRDLDELARSIKASVEHVQSVARAFTDLLQPANSNKLAAADPLPILRHSMSVCQDLAMKAHASIICAPCDALPSVNVAPGALMQVLINLITNGLDAIAAKDTPGGTVTVAASTTEKMLVLAIRDDGVGMSQHVLARVGTPFFTTREDHTGIGVAQCQRLVGAAGGRIQFASSQRRGTTVTISLPIAPRRDHG